MSSSMSTVPVLYCHKLNVGKQAIAFMSVTPVVPWLTCYSLPYMQWMYNFIHNPTKNLILAMSS